jgi:hypothetical protein
MSGSFYNEKATTSWILNQYRPDTDVRYAQLQATPFGMSSLAAVGCNYLAMDYGSQIYGLEKRTMGVPFANIDLYSTDKSVLGVEAGKRTPLPVLQGNIRQAKVTVPNEQSLKSKYTLRNKY